MCLSEAVLHGWNVPVGFDPQATLNAQETDVLVEQLTGPLALMLGFLGKPEAPSGAQATLRVEITNPRPWARPCARGQASVMRR